MASTRLPTSNDSPPTSGFESEARAQIARTTQDFHVAMVTRNFDAASPLWSSLADSFVHESPHPGFRALTRGKKEFLNLMQRVHSDYPEYKYHVLDWTTQIDCASKSGSVFLNKQTEGMPRGVTRRFMTVLHFTKRKEGWVMIRSSSLENLSTEEF